MNKELVIINLYNPWHIKHNSNWYFYMSSSDKIESYPTSTRMDGFKKIKILEYQ